MTIETLFYLLMFLNMGSELFFFLHEKRYEKTVRENVIPDIAPYAPENYDWERELSYKSTRRTFGLFSAICGFVVTLAFFATGLFAYVMSIISVTWKTPFWQGFWFAFLLIVVYRIYSIPFAWWGSFVIEERFGFNRKTVPLFWKDLLTGTGIAITLGPVFTGLIVHLAGKAFGIPLVFITVIVFSFFLSFIFPIVIMPLFYRITSLEEGDLRNRVHHLIQKTGLPVKGAYKADQSKRSAHANAMVAGMGRSKKIILFDTLLSRMSISGVIAVVAHELGHWSKKHTRKLLLAGISEHAALFMIVWIMWNSQFSASVFGIENMALPRLIIIIFIVSSIMGLFLSPLESRLSRKYEFEADQFAAYHTDPETFSDALSALATGDLAWIPPSPLYSTWFSSHPSIPERLLGLSRIRDDRNGPD